MCITGSTLSSFTEYENWSDLLPNSYSSSDEGVFIGRYSTTTIDLLHLLFTSSTYSDGMVNVEKDGNDTPTCGWSDIPCKTINAAVTLNTPLTRVKLVYSSSPHDAESQRIVFSHLESFLIEGEVGGSSATVEKRVSNIDAVLFTIKHCENITFSSIAFTIQSSSLSHSLFYSTFSYLTLTSISISPYDSTTSIQLDQSLIVSTSTLNISNSSFKSIQLSEGNGSAINCHVGIDLSFVVVNSSFSYCSAIYGGAVYLMISGDPSVIELSNVAFEGNSASTTGNTLYVVWRSMESMYSNQFSSFVTLSEEMNEEAKVETGKEIVTLAEFVSDEEEGSGSGSEGEGKNIYAVCTQIEISDSIGKVIVAVVNETEELSGDGCIVGMEGGEVSGDVEIEKGEVNGEGVVVDMGSELTKVLGECEDIKIVLNITYGLSNG